MGVPIANSDVQKMTEILISKIPGKYKSQSKDSFWGRNSGILWFC